MIEEMGAREQHMKFDHWSSQETLTKCEMQHVKVFPVLLNRMMEA